MPAPDVPKLLERFRVAPGKRFSLSDHDPAWAGDHKVPKEQRKRFAEEVLGQDRLSLAEAQERLWASDTWSILVILQALDAAGKDGLIKHVMSGVNPQGCKVTSFKQPTDKELDHNFLWRYVPALPERGQIGIFNRSYYEEVLVVRVHPELVQRQRIPGADSSSKRFWRDRYDDINAFEQHLARNGTRIVKFFLNLSKDEQRKRFLKRLDDPEKHWKFSAADVRERGYWKDYRRAIQDMIGATSTEWAPWHVLPADHKWVTRALASSLLVQTVASLDLSYPPLTPSKRAEMEEARRLLDAEKDETEAHPTDDPA